MLLQIQLQPLSLTSDPEHYTMQQVFNDTVTAYVNAERFAVIDTQCVIALAKAPSITCAVGRCMSPVEQEIYLNSQGPAVGSGVKPSVRAKFSSVSPFGWTLLQRLHDNLATCRSRPVHEDVCSRLRDVFALDVSAARTPHFLSKLGKH